jgi:NAD(P)-dependent dehydrogenase (short-subunit alcohol dehydrogenase family)
MGATPTVFIAAIASDIGRELALRYLQRGFAVIGTYRSGANLDVLRESRDIELIQCDVTVPESIEQAAHALRMSNKRWELFIGAVGQLDPIGAFFDCDIGEWTRSVFANSVGQLSLLHALYPFNDTTRHPAKVAFLVGGGISRSFRNYSAYSLGKVMLVKFCELIDDEYPNVHAIAVGTGWVNTKIHQQTLDARAKAGANFRRTYEFVATGQGGTPIADILACMDWCFGSGRSTTGGRNISVVHDSWKDDGDTLAAALAADRDLFKLRRKDVAS